MLFDKTHFDIKYECIEFFSTRINVGGIKHGETPLISPTAKFSFTPIFPAIQYQQFHDISIPFKCNDKATLNYSKCQNNNGKQYNISIIK